MVPYDQLLPIEQAIVDWKIAHPELMTFIDVLLLMLIGALMAISVMDYLNQRKIEQERICRERAEKRAWIKANGGL